MENHNAYEIKEATTIKCVSLRVIMRIFNQTNFRMRNDTKLALLFILLFTCISTSAINDTTIVQSICYPDESTPMNNVILANLSPALAKENNKPCLRYSLNLKYNIVADKVQLFYNSAKVTNTVIFQGFSLRDLMLPVSIELEAHFISSRETIEKKRIKFEMLKEGLFFTYNIPSGKSISIVNFKVVKIEFGQQMLDRIVSRQQLINDYYSADVQIKLAEEELKKIDFDVIDNNDRFQEISSKVLATDDRIKSKQFDSKLYLNENDPVNLQHRLSELYNKAHGSKTKLVSQTSNLCSEYYRIGLSALQKNDTATAIINFNNAIAVNPRFAMPFVQIAAIELDSGNYNKVISIIRHVDNNTDHDTSSVNHVNVLINRILNEFVEDIRLIRQQKNLSEALIQIDSCYRICSTISIVKCPTFLDTERNHIYTSILEKFITDNQVELDKCDYQRYRMVTDSMYKFYSKNSDYIASRTMVYDHLNGAYKILIQDGQKNIEGNPTQALEALMTSKYLCENYSEVSCNPQVAEYLNSIFDNLYNSMVDEAVLLFDAQKYESADTLQNKANEYCKQQNINISDKHVRLIYRIKEQQYTTILENFKQNKYTRCEALQMVDSAIIIRKHFNISALTNETRLHHYAVQMCINQMIVDAEKCIISRYYDEAKNCLNKAESLAKNYGIVIEQPTSARIAEIKGQLGHELCNDVKLKIDIQLNASDLHLRNCEYIYATQALNRARLIVESNLNCGFTTDDIDNKIKYYELPTRYQIDYDKIIGDIQNHRFEQANTRLGEVAQHYSDSMLRKYNIKQLKLVEFVKHYDYVPFTLGTIEYLAQNGNTEHALTLLYFLYENEIDEDITSKAQDKLGRSLAKRDVVSQKDKDPTISVYQYVRHDKKWFKQMINSYKKQWRKSIVSLS